MSRKVETVLTLSVRFKLPERSNASEIMGYVRSALCSYGKGTDGNKNFIFSHEDLTVKLIEKKTTYV